MFPNCFRKDKPHIPHIPHFITFFFCQQIFSGHSFALLYLVFNSVGNCKISLKMELLEDEAFKGNAFHWLLQCFFFFFLEWSECIVRAWGRVSSATCWNNPQGDAIKPGILIFLKKLIDGNWCRTMFYQDLFYFLWNKNQ